MKVYNINPALQNPHFNGIKKQHKLNQEYNTPETPKVSGHKLNNALKAAILVPILAGSMAACDRTETEHDYVINPPDYSESMYTHRFPELTVNGVTFSAQTVNINKNLDPDSKVNRSINSLLNTLDVPKKTNGAFPVNMFWSQGNHVYHMVMDGSLTNDDNYVYHLSNVNKKAGTVDNYVLNFSDDGTGLKLDMNGTDEYNNYNFVNKGDSILMYKNNENDSEKLASFKKKIIHDPYGKDKYTVEQTTFADDTTKVSNENFVVWCVNNEK